MGPNKLAKGMRKWLVEAWEVVGIMRRHVESMEMQYEARQEIGDEMARNSQERTTFIVTSLEEMIVTHSRNLGGLVKRLDVQVAEGEMRQQAMKANAEQIAEDTRRANEILNAGLRAHHDTGKRMIEEMAKLIATTPSRDSGGRPLPPPGPHGVYIRADDTVGMMRPLDPAEVVVERARVLLSVIEDTIEIADDDIKAHMIHTRRALLAYDKARHMHEVATSSVTNANLTPEFRRMIKGPWEKGVDAETTDLNQPAQPGEPARYVYYPDSGGGYTIYRDGIYRFRVGYEGYARDVCSAWNAGKEWSGLLPPHLKDAPPNPEQETVQRISGFYAMWPKEKGASSYVVRCTDRPVWTTRDYNDALMACTLWNAGQKWQGIAPPRIVISSGHPEVLVTDSAPEATEEKPPRFTYDKSMGVFLVFDSGTLVANVPSRYAAISVCYSWNNGGDWVDGDGKIYLRPTGGDA